MDGSHSSGHHKQEEPVDATEYRALLDAMMRELGDRAGYSFIKENADTEQAEVRWLCCVVLCCVVLYVILAVWPHECMDK
jgi:hypothetical protein